MSGTLLVNLPLTIFTALDSIRLPCFIHLNKIMKCTNMLFSVSGELDIWNKTSILEKEKHTETTSTWHVLWFASHEQQGQPALAREGIPRLTNQKASGSSLWMDFPCLLSFMEIDFGKDAVSGAWPLEQPTSCWCGSWILGIILGVEKYRLFLATQRVFLAVQFT